LITRYVSVRAKFCIAFVGSISWLFLSVYLSLPWLSDLSEVLGPYLAVYVIAFVAIIPGFMNAFIVLSLLLDARPIRKSIAEFPPVTVFVPAYNEEKSIRETVQSLLDQVYPGKLSITVINDGSSDGTAAEVESMLSSSSDLELINLPMNAGKSEALNYALSMCESWEI